MNLKIDFNFKKFLFFIAIFIVGFLVYSFVSNQLISASVSEVATVNYATGGYDIPISIMPNGKVKIADKYDDKVLNVEKDYDLFKYVAYSKDGLYVNNLRIIINLPKGVKDINYLNPRVYAVHGAMEGTYKMLDENTLVFETTNLTPNATYTVELELPKGFVNMPWDKELLYSLKNLSIGSWIILGNVPFLITLAVLFYIYHLYSKDWNKIKTDEISDTLPSDLNSAEAGALVNGKISSRAIAAILLDMAYKGVIKIVDKGEFFTFYLTGKNISDLRNYEKILINKLFEEKNKRSSEEDIDIRISKHVFSRKIAQIYIDIYENLDKKGYFIQNIDKYQSSYKRIGYFMFFFGILGFLINLIYYIDFPYMLIPWFSIVISSIFIIKLSSRIPRKNELGLAETKKWIMFKNFLAQKKEFGYSYEAQGVYEKYLPYAVSFGVERQWSQRFARYPFVLPNWLLMSKKVVKIEDILNEILPFVEFISSKLSQIKEPTV